MRWTRTVRRDEMWGPLRVVFSAQILLRRAFRRACMDSLGFMAQKAFHRKDCPER